VGRRWTTSDDAFIRENYPTRGGKWCACELGRDPSATRCRAKKLGVRLLRKNLTHIKTTESQRLKIVELYSEGMSGPKISTALQIKHDTVYNALHAAGVSVDVTGTRNKRWTEAEESEMATRYLNGQDTISLARHYFTSQSAVWLVLTRNGVDMRPASWGGGPRLGFVDRLGRAFKMRSTWELGTASWLDEQALSWDYELTTFRLMVGGKSRRYTPDFWIYGLEETLVVDVKGVENPDQMEKIEALKVLRPDLNLQVWDYWELKRRGILTTRRSNHNRSRFETQPKESAMARAIDTDFYH